jgi:hypothetical protein
MATSPPPVQLGAGILFETSRQLLKWGCTRAEAWALSGATHYNLPDDDTRIQWNENVFGLPCGILAYLPDDSRLDSVDVWLRLPENWHPRDALYQYCRFFDRLFEDFGTPYIKPAVGNIYAPILTWERLGCFLQLYTGERMGDFTVLEISHGKEPRFKPFR